MQYESQSAAQYHRSELSAYSSRHSPSNKQQKQYFTEHFKHGLQ